MLNKKICKKLGLKEINSNEKYGLKIISSLAVCAVISGAVPAYATESAEQINSNVNSQIAVNMNSAVSGYADNQSALNNTLSECADSSDIIVNSRLKEFSNLDKVKKYTGFDFKVPDYTAYGCGVHVIRVFNETDGRSELELQFSNKDTGLWYSIEAFTTDPALTLTKEFEESFDKAAVTTSSKNISGINGQYITLTDDSNYTAGTPEKCSYFVWKNENVWYCMNYDNNIGQTIGEDEIGRIALSLKNPEEAFSVNYVVNYEDAELMQEDPSYEPSLSIYDKEDLNKACEVLGYTPKLPLKINNNIVISDASTTIDELGKSLFSTYSYDKGILVFIQTKDKDRYKYEDIVSTGYSTLGTNVKVDKLSMNGLDVYRYADNGDNKIVYQWKEDHMYYFFEIYYDNGVIEYADDVVKEFVNAQPAK